ncbi:MAG: glycosyltransferase family 4 protein [Dehalococcoidia bacterium]|nr:glycosyltransferase family 4 protein [Dehalococcoidia bacterium]
MRIAFISPYDWSVHGGVNSHIRHLADIFREWGHDVTIFAPASEPEQVADQCVVLGKPYGLRVSGSVARITFAWSAPRVKKLLAEGRFDVIHLHEPLMPLLPYHFLRYSRAANVGTFHAAKDGGLRLYGYTRPFTRRWFRKLDGKIAVSPAAARLVSRYFAGYFNIIPNGIEFDHWSEPREKLPEFDDGKVNILFVGRPEKRKGLKYLLRAYLRLRQKRDDIRLIVVGAGDFTRYQRLMEPFPDIVFRSNVDYEELPRFHHTSDVFCAPNTGNESQGYVIMEALAAGLPVVASNIEGFAGVITHESEGLLVRPKDEAAIEEGILRLIRDPALRERLALRGQEHAREYGWDTVAHKVMSYYERLVYERQQVEEVHARRRARATGTVGP